MKKFASLIFSLVLCICLAVPVAAAGGSNQGGNNGGNKNAPKTGVSSVAVLAATSCTACGVGIVAYKKSKE